MPSIRYVFSTGAPPFAVPHPVLVSVSLWSLETHPRTVKAPPQPPLKAQPPEAGRSQGDTPQEGLGRREAGERRRCRRTQYPVCIEVLPIGASSIVPRRAGTAAARLGVVRCFCSG